MAALVSPDATLDLVFTRVVDVPRELVFKAWTTPEHLKQWFTPAPWQTVDAEVDLRPGGIFKTVMRSPEGQDFPNLGCWLDVVTNERIVFTDALGPGFRPTANSFMTATVTFEDHQGATKYTAHVLHKSVEDRIKHEQMGFHDGWGKALDQLVALVKRWQ